MNARPLVETIVPQLNLLGLVIAGCLISSATARADDCCEPVSWMFQPGTYTHAPETGVRVAQYARHEPVEGLPDPRLVTSGYRTTRTNLRGADGSLDTYYEVQNWANGRGGLDAEWERFHDAWQESYLTGSYYNAPAYGYHRGYPSRYGRGYGPRYGPGYRHPRPTPYRP